MIIAREKKKNNISEYILYMWQIEDVIRSHNFDIQAIEKAVISQFDVALNVKVEMKAWYNGLIDAMRKEEIMAKGHLSDVMKYVEELNNLHGKLLTVLQDQRYLELYYDARKNIDELIAKSDYSIKGDVEACLTGLYGLLVLKLKRVPVSDETQAAMTTFSTMLAYLSQQYQLHREGKLTLSSERSN